MLSRALVGVAVAVSGLAFAAIGTAPASAADTSAVVLELDPTDYPQCTDDGVNRSLTYMVNRIHASEPESFLDDPNGDRRLYQVPTAAQREDFRAGLNALIDDNVATANQRLAEADYTVCSGDVDSVFARNTVFVHQTAGLRSTTSRGAPTLMLRPSVAAEATVLSAPHLSEDGIVDQVLGLVAHNALTYIRGAVLAGTHRCNRTELAPAEYQGGTDQCSGTYRISDMAHNIDTIYQDMHDVLRQQYPQTFQVQLHRMSQTGISVTRGDNPADGSATFPADAVAVAHSYALVELRSQMGTPDAAESTCIAASGGRGRCHWSRRATAATTARTTAG